MGFKLPGRWCFGATWVAHTEQRSSLAALTTSARWPIICKAFARRSLLGWPRFRCINLIWFCSHRGKLSNLDVCSGKGPESVVSSRPVDEGSRSCWSSPAGSGTAESSCIGDCWDSGKLSAVSSAIGWELRLGSLATSWLELAGGLVISRGHANIVMFNLHPWDGRTSCRWDNLSNFSQCFSKATWLDGRRIIRALR